MTWIYFRDDNNKEYVAGFDDEVDVSDDMDVDMDDKVSVVSFTSIGTSILVPTLQKGLGDQVIIWCSFGVEIQIPTYK
jgi:hypothetical protein